MVHYEPKEDFLQDPEYADLDDDLDHSHPDSAHYGVRLDGS